MGMEGESAVDDSTVTPLFLVQELQKLSGERFEDLRSLNHKIDEITSNCHLRFHAYCTGPSKKTQKYCCDHRRNGCRAYFTFLYEDSIATFDHCDVHHNHDVTVKGYRRRNVLTQKQRAKIKEATKSGWRATQIRLQGRLTCNKDVLYSARRAALHELKDSEIPDMIAELDKWPGWEHVVNEDGGILQSLYAFNKAVMQQAYAQDVCIIDDTACTNNYGLPVLAAIVEDENARSQLLSFCFMRDRTKPSFVQFLSQLRERVKTIRVFVMDRNKTQSQAVLEVFGESHIIYCAIHIGRNIKQILGPKHPVYLEYQAMRNGLVEPEAFYTTLFKAAGTNSSKESKFMRKLMRESDRWLPTKTAQLMHRGNDTSNRVEGFFGSLKNLLDNKRVTLSILTRALLLRAERMRLCSLADRSLTLPDDLLDKSECAILGLFPAAVVLSEYDDLNLRTATILHPYGDDCCVYRQVYGIPCRHLLLERVKADVLPLLTSDDFSPRWRRCHQDAQITSTVSFEHDKPSKEEDVDWSYPACVARFEKYFSLAKKSPSVQRRLIAALDSLMSTEHESSCNGPIGGSQPLRPPASVPVAGCPDSHPRRNVDHTPRTRYKCSHCHETGHTRPRCPLLAQQVVIPADQVASLQ